MTEKGNSNKMHRVEDLVSIITPAYNCANTIRDTIESVLAQTWSKWEMIIVNDCSKDQTKEIVEEYAQMDNRIRLVNLEKNSGSAVARNTAIDLSKGRYIALLDSDDMWKPEKLNRQIMFMRQKKCPFSFTAYDIFKDKSDIRRRMFEVPETIGYKAYLKNTIIGCLTVMIDYEYIPDFHMEAGYLEDILTWMHYLDKGIVAYGLNENLASYRVALKSKSSNKIKNSIRYYKCLKLQPNITYLEKVYCELCYICNALKKRIFGKIITINE